MIDRRTFLGAAGAATLGAVVAGCAPRTSGPEHVRLWGVGGAEAEIEAEVIEDFLAERPTATVNQSRMPESSTGDSTYAITAVRGGTAPDLWIMDRYTTAQFASLGLLEPLDPLIAEHESEGFVDQWAQFAMDEVRYDDQIFGLPYDTDTRALFYNKETFRQAGLDPDELDPENGPITIARVLELNEELAEVDGRGNYTRLGLLPWDSEGWALTWAIGRGAQFYDNDTGQMDLTSPEVLDVLELFRAVAQEMGYAQVQAFKATYEPPNSPEAQNAFFGGQQGMQINGSVSLQSIRNYVPDLDFGVTYLPVWEAGDDPYSWSGGFSLVAPVGSSLSPTVWNFLKHYCGAPGQGMTMGPLSKIPTHLDVLADYAAPGAAEEFMAELLPWSVSRPPLPIGQLFWDSMEQAQESVLHGSATPQEAAETAQARVGPQMELYQPFQLPAGYGVGGL